MENVDRFPIQRVTEDDRVETEDTVVRELPLTILLNGKELVTMACSPSNLESLAVGFLFSEGLLEDRDEIQGVLLDEQRGIVRINTRNDIEPDTDLLAKRIITSGCGRGASFYRAADVLEQARIESGLTVGVGEILSLVREFQHHSEIFKTTGGVHSAALCDNKEILVFIEDIGRHNAIDKIFGHCILNGIATDDRIIVTSGRISSEILIKVARRRIPMIVSVSAPTDLGVKAAGDLGITLIGFVRGKRMNIYTGAERVV